MLEGGGLGGGGGGVGGHSPGMFSEEGVSEREREMVGITLWCINYALKSHLRSLARTSCSYMRKLYHV